MSSYTFGDMLSFSPRIARMQAAKVKSALARRKNKKGLSAVAAKALPAAAKKAMFQFRRSF